MYRGIRRAGARTLYHTTANTPRADIRRRSWRRRLDRRIDQPMTHVIKTQLPGRDVPHTRARTAGSMTAASLSSFGAASLFHSGHVAARAGACRLRCDGRKEGGTEAGATGRVDAARSSNGRRAPGVRGRRQRSAASSTRGDAGR